MPDVFISYSRRNIEFVQRLGAELAGRGKDVWLDIEDIPPASRWTDDLHEGIESADAFVFVISAESVASTECRKELEQAVGLGKRIVPLHYGEVDHAALPESLSSLNFVPQRGVFEDDPVASMDALVSAIETDLEWVKTHTQRLQRAQQWDRNGRDRSLLLSGSDLHDAEAWLASGADKEPRPTRLQIEHIQASRAATTRRNRIFSGAVSGALVVAIVLSVVAFLERDQAIKEKRQAVSRELSADAVETRATDPELSILLARRALETIPTQQAESAMRQALNASFIRRTVSPPSGAGTAAPSADGQLLLTDGATDHVARLWRLGDGHPAGVLPGTLADGGAKFSPTGAEILTLDRGGRAAVYDEHTIARRYALDPAGPPVTAAAWSADGRRLAAARSDGTVAVFRAGSGTPSTVLRGPRLGLTDVALAGRIVAAGSATAVTVWDLASPRRPPRRLNASATDRVLLSADGTRLLTFGAGGNGTATLWEPRSGRHSDLIAGAGAADIAGSGRTLALGTVTGAVYVFSARDGKQIAYNTDHSGRITTVAMSGDASRVLSASSDGHILVSDAASGRTIASLLGTVGSVLDARFTPDGHGVVSAGQDGLARIWAAAPAFPALAAPSSVMAISPDGRLLVEQAGDGSLRLLNAATGGAAGSLSPPGRNTVSDVRFSADGSRVAAGGTGVRVWRTSDRHPLLDLERPGLTLGSYALSPDGSRVVATWIRQGALARVELTDVATPTSIVLPVRAENLAFSGDGSQLALTLSGQAAADLYDTRSGHFLRRVRAAPGASSDPAVVAYAAHAPRLAVSFSGGVQVLDQRSGARIGKLIKTPLGSFAVALSGDGSQVVAGGFAPLVRNSVQNSIVEDVAVPSGTRLSTLAQGDSQSVSAQFSQDGRFILTSTESNQSFVYEAATGAVLLQLRGANPSWDRSGTRIVDVDEGADRTRAELWSCDVCRDVKGLLALARQRETRPFSAGERAKYLNG